MSDSTIFKVEDEESFGNVLDIKNISNVKVNKTGKKNIQMENFSSSKKTLEADKERIEENKKNSTRINLRTQSISSMEYKTIKEEKVKKIEELNNEINNEISKIVICGVCKSKFANKAHYLRHTTLSELHKININKFS